MCNVSFKRLKIYFYVVKKRGISCSETDKYTLFVNVEQVAYNYLNIRVITKNCVSKAEGHPEVI